MNVLLSFISGIFAAFTPCVVVLIPLILGRFLSDGKRKGLFFLSLGFVFSFLLFAGFLSAVFSSTFQNGFRLGFGILFVVLGFLSFQGKVNPFGLPILKNSFVLGAGYALIVAFSPCALPYIGLVISFSGVMIFLHLLAFSIGLLVPSILFTLIGKSFLDFAFKGGKFFHHIGKLMSIVLVISGVYLIIMINSFGSADAVIAGGLLFLVFILLMRTFFLGKKDLKNPWAILLIVSLLMIIVSVVFSCLGRGSVGICGDSFFRCAHCKRCIALFSIALLAGVFGILGYVKSKK